MALLRGSALSYKKGNQVPFEYCGVKKAKNNRFFEFVRKI